MSTQTGLTVDDMADKVLERVAQAFGECLQDEKFTGFALDEHRDDAGRLVYLRLVPCDEHGDEPVRRWPNRP